MYHYILLGNELQICKDEYLARMKAYPFVKHLGDVPTGGPGLDMAGADRDGAALFNGLFTFEAGSKMPVCVDGKWSRLDTNVVDPS